MDKRKIVILHGLFMTKHVMIPLSRRLQNFGYETVLIDYSTRRINKDKLYASLDEAVGRDKRTVLVGHSLGGLVSKAYITDRKLTISDVSDVVTLATPHKGAAIADTIKKLGLEKVIGNSHTMGLYRNECAWELEQRLGSIAGTVPVGVRPLFGIDKDKSDGTVSLSETRIDGMTDHIELKANHTGIIYAWESAVKIDEFIRNGQFS